MSEVVEALGVEAIHPLVDQMEQVQWQQQPLQQEEDLYCYSQLWRLVKGSRTMSH